MDDAYMGTVSGFQDVLLTTDEVAAYLKVPKSTVDGWQQYGRGPKFIRVGRYRRYLLSDVEAWVGEQKDGRRPRS